MERGFTYFDTAVMYNGFASQRVAKEAILDRYPRDHIACGGGFAHWAHFCLYSALRAAEIRLPDRGASPYMFRQRFY